MRDLIVSKLNAAFGGDWSRMAGTETTYSYVVVAGTSLGRVGLRRLAGAFRVRVEPLNGSTLPGLTRESGWKQPGDEAQPRYSTVVSPSNAGEALRSAVAALRRTRRKVIFNPDAPEEIREAVTAA